MRKSIHNNLKNIETIMSDKAIVLCISPDIAEYEYVNNNNEYNWDGYDIVNAMDKEHIYLIATPETISESVDISWITLSDCI